MSAPDPHAEFNQRVSEVRSDSNWESTERSLRAWIDSVRDHQDDTYDTYDTYDTEFWVAGDRPSGADNDYLDNMLGARRALLREHGVDVVDHAIFGAAVDYGLQYGEGDARPRNFMTEQMRADDHQRFLEAVVPDLERAPWMREQHDQVSTGPGADGEVGYDLWADDAGIGLD